MKARNCTNCRRRIHEEEKENFLKAEYSMMQDMGKSFAVYAISAVLMTMIRRGRSKKYIQQMYDDMCFIFDTPSIMGKEVTTTTIMKMLQDEYGIDFDRVNVHLESEKEFVSTTKNLVKERLRSKEVV